ncbi:MAG: tyrosine-protein kinase family protein [Sulfuricaulis sp.]
MSKIEKALNKARASGSLRVVSPQSVRERTPDSVPAVSQATALVEQRNSASEAIARMQEITPLDKQALDLNRIIYPQLGENGTVRAFRELRTKIIQKSQGRNCVVMVTSVAGNGGSSFVTLNLGVAFAFDAGKTALLLDCNIRNPSLHRLFKSGTFHGLADYLENPEVDIADIIHPVGIDRLRIIPSGGRREIPSEYFTSSKMKRLLESITQRFHERYILIDAPPMTESADTQILAELCDYVVLVVPYARVTEAQVAASAKAIGEKKLLGIVFNDEPDPPTLAWHNLFNPLMSLWEILFRRNNK